MSPHTLQRALLRTVTFSGASVQQTQSTFTATLFDNDRCMFIMAPVIVCYRENNVIPASYMGQLTLFPMIVQ